MASSSLPTDNHERLVSETSVVFPFSTNNSCRISDIRSTDGSVDCKYGTTSCFQDSVCCRDRLSCIDNSATDCQCHCLAFRFSHSHSRVQAFLASSTRVSSSLHVHVSFSCVQVHHCSRETCHCCECCEVVRYDRSYVAFDAVTGQQLFLLCLSVFVYVCRARPRLLDRTMHRVHVQHQLRQSVQPPRMHIQRRRRQRV